MTLKSSLNTHRSCVVNTQIRDEDSKRVDPTYGPSDKAHAHCQFYHYKKLGCH